MFAHLLLPTDGSEFSEAAIRKGLRLARECKAKVTALCVTPEFHVFTFDTTMLEDTKDRFLSDSKAQAEKNLAMLLGSETQIVLTHTTIPLLVYR